MDEYEKLAALRKQGFFCSQILMLLGLELQGKTNPDLVRSMHGLAGGIGFNGETCGVLTGSACLMGLYAGNGLPEEDEDPRLMFMIQDLFKWFNQNIGEQYGSIRCEEILQGDRRNMAVRCPDMILSAYQKCKDLLVENGFDLSGIE